MRVAEKQMPAHLSPRDGGGGEPLGGRTGHTGKGFEGTVGRKLDKEVREGTLRRQGVRMKSLGLGQAPERLG